MVVRAPKRASPQFIETLVGQRQDWIKKALSRFGQTAAPKQFIEGELFLYLGKEYGLRILESYRSRLVFDNAFYISRLKLGQAKKLFKEWYKQQAQIILTERAKFFSAQMHVTYNKITVRDTSSRWGSCSTKGNINFSYRLIMAPQDILDYVVVHELAHLVHHNHSKLFWRFVQTHYPSFSQARLWLRKQGANLKI